MSVDQAASSLPPLPPIVDDDPHVLPASWATPEIAGIGGSIKQRPEDFLVEEQPLYQPCGEGEHAYVLVQKRGMSTLAMLEVIASHFGVRRKDVGFAGLKDKHAITRQVVSIHMPGRRNEEVPELRHESISILWVDRHTNKLRPGHLRGNRFSIRIRSVRPTDVLAAHRVLMLLKQRGVPNRLGEQRFGMIRNNHLLGRALLLGEFEEATRILLGPQPPRLGVWNAEARELFAAGKFEQAIHHYPKSARTETRVLRDLSRGVDARRAMLNLDETVLRFYLSSFQSAVFNMVLDARLRDGGVASLRVGDLAIKQNLAVFPVDAGVLNDPATAQRVAAFEIGPSGPMWGATMPRAGGEIDAMEVDALRRFGLTPEHIAQRDKGGRLGLDGKRRPLRVPVIDPEVEGGVDEHGPFVRVAFELPRGSFATVVLAEIMKPTSLPVRHEPEQAGDQAGEHAEEE